MAATDKDTIYIDIDDEITSIIDKLRGSSAKVVALVLPKRAAVFQSIVNMKLLKRAADSDKKNVVLITSEAGLLPLAGAAGVHVAKTLNSKPEIPTPPQFDDGHEEEVEERADDAGPIGNDDDDEEVTTATAGNKPVGQLAGLGAAAIAADEVETVELDNGDEAEAVAAPKSKAFKPPKSKKDKKLHVPNFERFRVLLIIGGVVLIGLIIVAIVAINVLPAATITVQTDATNVDANLNLNLSTTATTLDASSNTLPAKLVQQAKTYTQQVSTTGTQNNGTKAAGSITIGGAQECAPNLGQPTLVAGSAVTSGGLTYITQADTDFTFKNAQGSCVNYKASGSTPITAQNAGAKYNTSGNATFTISGHSDMDSGSGSASGGSDDIVQIVSQSDIDNAKGKINTEDPTVKQALQNQLQQDNYYAIAATFSAGTPAVTTSANVGDAANTVTVTEVVTYTMFGVQQNDLKTLVDNSVKSQIDTSKQSILSEGLDSASFTVQGQTATTAQLAMSSKATAGPQLDTNAIKQQAMGKKSADVEGLLQNDPDVTNVSVKLSPFFVTSVPHKANKITVIIAKPTTTVNSSSNGQ